MPMYLVNADIRSAADMKPIFFAQSAKKRSHRVLTRFRPIHVSG